MCELKDIWPDDLDFTCGASSAYLQVGDTSFVLPASFENWYIRVFRAGGFKIWDERFGSGGGNLSYNYNPITRLVTLSVGGGDQEEFFIEAVKPSA